MKWTEIKVVTSAEFADFVSLLLIEAGSEGTVIKDSADVKEMLSSGIIWDYVDESLLKNSDPRVFVSGFFCSQADTQAVVRALEELGQNADCDTGSFEISVSQIDSSDWENEWKKYYMPIEFSRFAIVPEWTLNHAITGKKVIKLNPGMAFGTGSHETTSMCLEFMDEIDFEGKIAIDLGCGSGILGLTAAALGAKAILTDIDPYAIDCATQNATLNNLQNKVTIQKANLLNEQLTEHLTQEQSSPAHEFTQSEQTQLKADILTANLTAPLLHQAKQGIKNHLKTGGTLIISGILSDYANELLKAYETDFDLQKTKSKNDWRAYWLRGK